MMQRFKLIKAHEKVNFEEMMTSIAKESYLLEKVGGMQSVIDQKNKYKSPLGYLKWETQIGICASYLSSKLLNSCATSTEITDRFVPEICIQAIAKKAPARYISKEICEAFVNTPIPATERELAEIFPSVHILLPRNYLFDWENCEIASLVIVSGIARPGGARIEEEEEMARKLADGCGGQVYRIPDNLCDVPVLNIAAITSTGIITTKYIGGAGAKFSEESLLTTITKERRSTHEKIRRIAVNSLLIHLYEQELITVDSSTPIQWGGGFGKGRQSTPPLPLTWIGKTFRYERESAETTGAPRGPVQSHWRRGHWHTVLHGKQKAQRRTQWFKPVYVGGK